MQLASHPTGPALGRGHIRMGVGLPPAGQAESKPAGPGVWGGETVDKPGSSPGHSHCPLVPKVPLHEDMPEEHGLGHLSPWCRVDPGFRGECPQVGQVRAPEPHAGLWSGIQGACVYEHGSVQGIWSSESGASAVAVSPLIPEKPRAVSGTRGWRWCLRDRPCISNSVCKG